MQRQMLDLLVPQNPLRTLDVLEPNHRESAFEWMPDAEVGISVAVVTVAGVAAEVVDAVAVVAVVNVAGVVVHGKEYGSGARISWTVTSLEVWEASNQRR